MKEQTMAVRAYKLPKLLGGVQALKEVSCEMKKGEVFVLLATTELANLL